MTNNQQTPRLRADRKELRLTASACALALCAACNAPEVSTPKGAAAETADAGAVERLASADRNRAEALLYRWWGIFEAPDDVDVAPFFDDLFTDDVYLKMVDVELSGFEAIKTGFSNLPLDNGRSHQLSDVQVTPIGENIFQLDAAFTYQIALPEGSVAAGYSSYRHEITKQPDGRFLLSKLTAELGDAISITEFEESYAINRARGAIVQYLGLTDDLHSDYADITVVLSDGAEIRGMFDPEKESFNERGDGVLRGREEITNWLASRRQNFQWVSHRLTAIEVSTVAENVYQADATVGVEAQPHKGETIRVTLPIGIELTDDGGRFMKITRIDR